MNLLFFYLRHCRGDPHGGRTVSGVSDLLSYRGSVKQSAVGGGQRDRGGSRPIVDQRSDAGGERGGIRSLQKNGPRLYGGNGLSLVRRVVGSVGGRCRLFGGGSAEQKIANDQKGKKQDGGNHHRKNQTQADLPTAVNAPAVLHMSVTTVHGVLLSRPSAAWLGSLRSSFCAFA